MSQLASSVHEVNKGIRRRAVVHHDRDRLVPAVTKLSVSRRSSILDCVDGIGCRSQVVFERAHQPVALLRRQRCESPHHRGWRRRQVYGSRWRRCEGSETREVLAGGRVRSVRRIHCVCRMLHVRCVRRVPQEARVVNVCSRCVGCVPKRVCTE